MPYTTPPQFETLRTYMGGDYSVIPKGRIFFDGLVAQAGIVGRMGRKTLRHNLHWKPQAIAQETGQIRAGIGPFLTRRMRQRRAYAYTEVFPTRGNKSVRAQSVRGRMALEGLHVPTDAPWYPAFRSELLSFPAGRHDDAVDALGLVGQLLNKMANGFALKVEEKKPDRLAYVIRHDGSVRSNMSVFDIVQAKLRRKAMD